MQQLHHFRSNTCRHGAELSTCLCVNVCMSGGAAHSQRVRPFRPTSLPHTHLTSSVNVLVCLKSNTCYTTSFTCSCVKCTRTHIHTRPRKQQRVNWRSCWILEHFIFWFPLCSSLHHGNLEFSVTMTTAAGGGNGLDPLHCAGGVVAA